MSNEPNFQTDFTHRFEADADAKAQLATTVRLDSVKAEDFDTVFYPGGHGPMWDLAEDQNSVKLIETMLRAGKPVALVCHAPGALRHARAPDGKPLVQGKRFGIPTFEDKVAQRAIVMVLEAVFEQDFLPCSFGFRPGK